MFFVDRQDAGRRLAARLRYLAGEPVVVLGLPRGGVPVAAEVARALDVPLDVLLVRKLGVPFQPELGFGAIGEDGATLLNEYIVQRARISMDDLVEIEERERAELARRADLYRGARPRLDVAGRTVVIVDDGIATGYTARAACQVARALGAAVVILAVPVAPPDWSARMRGAADELVVLDTPSPFYAVGQAYRHFRQTSDDEAVACLDEAARRLTRPSAEHPEPHPVDEELTVIAHHLRLPGHLTLPPDVRGVVVFAHGSGSSRHSPRNRYVAGVLNDAGLGTLLFDLLTEPEEHDRENVFDIELLARRLVDATRWLRLRPEVTGLPLGYFGASTGAAAAVSASTLPGAAVTAVVSRGGRPDLAAERLHAVTVPTLLIVGGADETVLRLNERARESLVHAERAVAVVPGATHLFPEPGALQAVAELARDWFVRHMGGPTETRREKLGARTS